MSRLLLVAIACLLLPAAMCGAPEPVPEPEVESCDVSSDQDGDGEDAIACGGTDCDDTDMARAPGRPEVCDAANVDEDCDPSTFGVRDADGDGSVDAQCANVDEDGAVAQGDDCDDTRGAAHPGLPEVCDGIDNDCDGELDEGVLSIFYVDLDGDGHGDPLGDTLEWCTAPAGYSSTGDDCDDDDAGRNPGAPEVCDGRDNNCSSETDEGVLLTLYVDEDGDGFGTAATVQGCAEGEGLSTRAGDCDDANPALVNGSMHCVDVLQYEICQDGVWSAPGGCPTQQCFTQPNGVGMCR